MLNTIVTYFRCVMHVLGFIDNVIDDLYECGDIDEGNRDHCKHHLKELQTIVAATFGRLQDEIRE